VATAAASGSTARTSARSRQASLRKSIGIVPQDTVLFNDTLYHNIAYGNARKPAAKKCSKRRARRIWIASSKACRTAMTRWSANAA
jgi:ABC-type transport system involved in Fe-S cluster assembly fused permease/ATPase subunit